MSIKPSGRFSLHTLEIRPFSKSNSISPEMERLLTLYKQLYLIPFDNMLCLTKHIAEEKATHSSLKRSEPNLFHEGASVRFVQPNDSLKNR